MAIDDYLRAVYSWTKDGWNHEFTFALASMPDAGPLAIETPVPWAIVTAWNPMSVMLDKAQNEMRDRKLASMLQRGCVVRGPAEARSVDGRWREPGRVVFGLPRERVLEVARAFGQQAVIWGAGGSVGVLDCLSERLVVRCVFGRRFPDREEPCPNTP